MRMNRRSAANGIHAARESGRARLIACALAALLAALAWAAPARAAQEFSIEAKADGNAVVIHARARVRAHLPVLWYTLTDYEQLPNFVPGLRSSHVLEKQGNVLVVEQKGVMEVMMFSYPIEVTVESTERMPDSIGVRVLKGNLKQLEGGYSIEKVPGQENEFLLHWRGVIEPAFAMPPFITVPLMRSSLRQQFLGMVGEIERRQALLAEGERL